MTERRLEDAAILIVDDEEMNVRLLERLLRQSGYTNLRSTMDSRDVVSLYTTHQPDIVLLDLWMPHRNGFEILDDLRALIPERSYVPVLVLTADVTTEALERALLGGATDFVTKPITPQEVLLRVRNLLRTRFLHLQLERENAVLEQRVEERTRQLLQMEKLSAMGQLLAGVAHELNNPLTVVSAHAQLLRRTDPASPLAHRVDKIAVAADRCVRIVRNFLTLARERPPERGAVDLNTVVGEGIELLAYELRSDGIEVRLNLAADLPVVWADSHQLHQVIVNLVANAYHALRRTAPPRRLTVTTRPLPSRAAVELTVADSGSGIPPEILGRIFEPFFTTKPPGQGTGLGLSLSHSIIQDHHGGLRVDSEPGRGAAFVIDLPIGSPPAGPALDQDSEALVPLEQKRILVVDDEVDVAEVLAEVLEAEGHRVDAAANGREALALIERHKYDVILSDTKMPELDGHGLFLEIERRHPELRRRLAFVTGDVVDAEKRAILERTGAPTLAKPFALDEVRRVVHRLLQAPQGA